MFKNPSSQGVFARHLPGPELQVRGRAARTYPVIIRVVIEDMRNQRCRRNLALKAKL